MEIWKDIKGYENLYQISNLGNIKSLNYHRQNREKNLLFNKNKYGYFNVFLYNKGKRIKYLVHRLVGQAFIDNPKNKPCINHINGIRNDNRIENLEWCTYSENEIHSRDVLKKDYSYTLKSLPNNKGKHGNEHPSSKPINQYTKEGEFIKTYSNAIEAKKQTGIGNGNISQCCYNKVKTAGGFIWKFNLKICK